MVSPELFIPIAIFVVAAITIYVTNRRKENTVPQGLEVFDGSGNKVFDTSGRYGRVVDIRSISGDSGSYNVPALLQGGTPFIAFHSTADFSPWITPYANVSGQTVTWNAPRNGSPGAPANTGIIVTGVY